MIDLALNGSRSLWRVEFCSKECKQERGSLSLSLLQQWSGGRIVKGHGRSFYLLKGWNRKVWDAWNEFEITIRISLRIVLISPNRSFKKPFPNLETAAKKSFGWKVDRQVHLAAFWDVSRLVRYYRGNILHRKYSLSSCILFSSNEL